MGEELGGVVKQFFLDAAPGAEGKEGGVHAAGGQIKAPRRGLRQGRDGLGGLWRGRDGVGHFQSEKAAAGAAFQIALGHQHLISGVHRVDRHPQLLGQGPFAGQAAARRNAAGPQLLHQPLIELLIKRAGAAVQHKGKLDHGTPSKLSL